MYDYITRSGKYKGKDDLLEYGSENMPDWATRSPRRLWTTADKYEVNIKTPKTKKEQKYLRSKCKSLIIALPTEMSDYQLKIYTKKILKKLFPGHAYTYAIHRPRSGGKLSGNDNPHVHVMLCTRLIDNDRPNLPPDQYFQKGKTCKNGRVTGGYRKDPAMRKQWLAGIKKQYAELMNQALKEITRDYVWGIAINAPKVEFKKSKNGSIHLGVKAVARAIANKQSKKLQYYIDHTLAPAYEAYKKEMAAVKNEYAPPADIGDYIATFIGRPSTIWNKKKREEELLAYRAAKIDKTDYFYQRDIDQVKEKAVKVTKAPRAVLNNIKRWCDVQGIDSTQLRNPSRYKKWVDMLDNACVENIEENQKIVQKPRKTSHINTHETARKPVEAKIERPRVIEKPKKIDDIMSHVHDSEKEKPVVIRGIHRKSKGMER